MIKDFRLTVFVTVARTLSFTRSAAVLNVSQPAISKHIKELERDFGEPLFSRHGNRIALTAKAEEIMPLVEHILEGYHLLGEVVSRDSRSFEGVIHVGASTTIAQYVLPRILAQFNREYPHIKLSLISANSEDVIRLLERKEIEIALIEGDTISSAAHYAPLAADKIVLVSTNNRKRELSLDELRGLPLLIREEGSGTLSVILSALQECGVSRRELNVQLQLGSSEAIVGYLKSSKHYAFISILAVREQLSRGELFASEVEGLDISRNFRFATLHGQSGRLVELFRTFCVNNYSL